MNTFNKTTKGHESQSEKIIENKYLLLIDEIFFGNKAVYPDKNKKKIKDESPYVVKIKYYLL